MKIIVVGLGLIGGSYALGLKENNHIYGYDINGDTVKYALDKGIIDYAVEDLSVDLLNADVLIIGLYPNKVLEFLRTYQPYFHENLVVTDVCGIKESLVYIAHDLSLPAQYCGHHPMAGLEKSGIMYANTLMFNKANFIITPIEKTTKYAIEVVRNIANKLEFGNIIEIDPKNHDLMIGYTSQLTHLISVALVNCEHSMDVGSFIGDSYRDLTRIAMINEVLWSELFLGNKEQLIDQIDLFTNELIKLKNSVVSEDKELLAKLLVNARNKRSLM